MLLVYNTTTKRVECLEVLVGGSGGGGTSNYNDLDNKPSINGNIIIGNKTSNQLELQNMSIEVQNSGDTLPVDTTGYSLGDKFLNTTDKKVYEVGNEYTLSSGVTNTATVNFVTGIANDFGTSGSQPTLYHYVEGTGYSIGEFRGSKTYRVHFKLNSVQQDDIKYGLFKCSTRSGATSSKNTGIYIKNKKIYAIQNESQGGNIIVNVVDRIVIDYEISANIEYYLEIIKNNDGTCDATLSTSNYNTEILSTNNFELGDWYGTYGDLPKFRFGEATGENYIEFMYYTFLTNGQIYLLDSSGDFLTPTSNVLWDSGTALVDNTQYIDINNNILWLFNNSKLIQLNSLVATINFYDVNNWTLDVTKTQLTVTGTLGNSVFVFKNGQLIQGGSGNDYTISGNVITFTTALEDTDKIAVINGNLTGIDLTPYLTASDLVPYQQKAQIIEDNRAQVTSLAIQANKVYKLTNANITEISFASCEQSELVTKIDFTTGATAPQFSDGNSINWADGETPHFYAYQHYWIIISNGVGFVKEIY